MFKGLFNKDTGDDQPDQKILDEISRRMENDPYLQDHRIDISVVDGVVTMHGRVVSPLLKQLAHDLVTEVPGVSEVRNELELGIGRPGDDLVSEDLASDDVAVSEGSNMGDPNLHHPSTTTFSEVVSQTPEDVTGGIDTGVTAYDAMQSAIPTTGSGSSVMDAGAVDAIRSSGYESVDDELASMLTKGMEVVDPEGKKVGKVKAVRKTDFHLSRTLARDLYVPYDNCTFDGQRVVLDIPADEITHQGWAHPGGGNVTKPTNQ